MTDIEEHPKSDKIVTKVIEDEVKTAYLEYAMSVIVGRALPDVKDGLKPVHRRTLFAMHQLGLASNKPTRKCARIVGEVIGKYHPHGDSAVYDTLVRMAQDFSLRYPLVIGQGNFGNIDGDSPAAMRYTEAKLSKVAESLLQDIDKETVRFVENFDGEEKEPVVLPAMMPNLLLSGSTGIAVGMATNMPPHNLTEVGNAVIALLDDEDTADEKLYELVTAPDFPTGGLIVGRSGIRSAYKTGHGKVIVRGKSHIEQKGTNKQSIIFTEIPYMIKKEDLLIAIDATRRDKIIPDISLVRDESDKDGMRVVIELKTGAQPDIVLNQLYKHTRLQTTFGISNLCLVDGVPKTLTLRQLLTEFIKHRVDVVTKRTQFLLRKAEEKAHLLAGLKIALDNLDAAIKIIRESKAGADAKEKLQSQFTLDEKQAQAILDMRLQRLTGLERDKIINEYNETLAKIAEYKAILAERTRVIAIIKEETLQVIENFGDERRTEIIDAALDIEDEDLIEDDTAVVTVTKGGLIKRVPIDTYKAQGRGGRGIKGTATRAEDVVEHLFTAYTKAYVLSFTNKGKVHWVKTYQIPEASRTAQGRSIANVVNLEKDEFVTAFIPVKEFSPDRYLVLVTKQGTIKKVALSDFSRPRASGIRAITLDDADELIGAKVTDGSKDILVASHYGLLARFDESNVRSMGRTARGVRAIKLADGDYVVGMLVPEGNEAVLTVTENGYGKRTKVDEYRLIGRGGKGVINIQTSQRNGRVVAVAAVTEETGILLISESGVIIRTRADQISLIGRNTQGVRLMRLGQGDSVSSIAKIEYEDDEESDDSESQ